MNTVRIQIAGVSTLEEARRLAAMGVDGLGFTLRLPSGVHDGLTEDGARAIIAAMPPLISTVAITYITDTAEAIAFCRTLGVNTLQLHAPVARGVISDIKMAAPGVKIIKSVHVIDQGSVDVALRAAEEADALILDTYDAATGRHGATGKTHDWRISRRIVQCSPKPVMLAGGLTPGNVAAALEAVRPWGVDVHTGIENADGTRNWEKITAFVRAVRAWRG
jgi:phosphoribosylanthranilate isomerase